MSARTWVSLGLALSVGCGAAGTSGGAVPPEAGSPDVVDSGSGGAASGGAAAVAGRPGSGGAIPAGGAPANGGASQTGGAPANGGASQTGGAPGSGGGTADAGGVTYATDFDLGESPISEGGAWHHDGLDWTRVDTENGFAFGTQALGVARSGPTAYDDSYAYLAGFPPDQQASATVHLGTIDGSCTHEVEILLRWADSAHSARGYECNVAWDGAYAQIVRWNGAVGDYTYLDANGSVPGGVHDGDVVSAAIVADRITLSVNGTVRATAQDSTFATGNPGVGFWRGMSGCGSRGDFGFTRFSASMAGP